MNSNNFEQILEKIHKYQIDIVPVEPIYRFRAFKDGVNHPDYIKEFDTREEARTWSDFIMPFVSNKDDFFPFWKKYVEECRKRNISSLGVE